MRWIASVLLKIPEARIAKMENRRLSDLIDGEAHRLNIDLDGWHTYPMVEKRLRRSIQLIGRTLDKPMAFVPNELCCRIFHQKMRAPAINVAAFAGRPAVAYMLDHEAYLKVTYCGNEVGTVLYASRLYELLNQLDE